LIFLEIKTGPDPLGHWTLTILVLAVDVPATTVGRTRGSTHPDDNDDQPAHSGCPAPTLGGAKLRTMQNDVLLTNSSCKSMK